MSLILRKIESLGRGFGKKLKLSFEIESSDLYSECTGMAGGSTATYLSDPYYVEAVVPFNPEYATLTIGALFSFEQFKKPLQVENKDFTTAFGTIVNWGSDQESLKGIEDNYFTDPVDPMPNQTKYDPRGCHR